MSMAMAQKDKAFHWSVVYGSLDAKKRELLWDSLNQMERLMKEPWLLAGDRNAILGAED